jgi:para-nitrobenzyl esterase
LLDTSEAVVNTESGKLGGKCLEGVYSYLGVPYGESTMGARRFTPPIRKLPWAGVRSAYQKGPCCFQNNDDLAAWQDSAPQSEDCLVANIWTPALDPQAALPVMVWIHGGAYSTGSGGVDLYDGRYLAGAEEIVVVSINHRLNLFGYLFLGEIGPAFSDSANLGQQDIVLALQWIRDNIAGFGGNPDNVTVFGESGGGAKISVLCGMPSAAGLFHRAIVQSGWLLNVLTPKEATERAAIVLRELGIGRNNLSQLQLLPANALNAAEAAISRRFGYSMFFPVADGHILPTNPWTSPSRTRAAVPMLIGTTRDEASYFVPTELYKEPPLDDAALAVAIQRTCAPIALAFPEVKSLINEYRSLNPGGITPLELCIQVATDLLFVGSSIHQAECHARDAAVFMYRFDWRYSCWGARYSPHGGEIPFIFNTLDNPDPAWEPNDSPQRRAAADPCGERFALARRMQAAWSAFARRGDPSNVGLPEWPRYTSHKRATMILDAAPRLDYDPHRARRQAATRAAIATRRLLL